MLLTPALNTPPVCVKLLPIVISVELALKVPASMFKNPSKVVEAIPENSTVVFAALRVKFGNVTPASIVKFLISVPVK